MQDFEKGGLGTSENLRSTKIRMKIVSPKISPIFCPKFGAGQNKGLRLPFVYLKLLPNLQREGPCRNFAYYSILIILSWRPKGEGMTQLPPPPKYAPAHE